MSMFDNYNSTATIPDNTPNIVPDMHVILPYGEYDVYGNLVGYYWHYQDIVTLSFDLVGEVTAPSDAIIYVAIGKTPTEPGQVNQYAYNITDKKCWKFDGLVWNELEFDSSDPNLTKPIYISADDYLKDKHVRVQIYNDKHQPLIDKDGKAVEGAIQTFYGESVIKFDIGKHLSEEMVRGVYYCDVIMFDAFDRMIDTVISQADCKLIVK